MLGLVAPTRNIMTFSSTVVVFGLLVIVGVTTALKAESQLQHYRRRHDEAPHLHLPKDVSALRSPPPTVFKRIPEGLRALREGGSISKKTNHSALALNPRSGNVPWYTPTTVIVNANAVTLILNEIFSVLDAALGPSGIAATFPMSWSSASGCTDQFGFSSPSIDIAQLQNAELTVLDDGFQFDVDFDLGLSVNFFARDQHQIIFCIDIGCSGSASARGTIHLTLVSQMSVEQGYLVMALTSTVLSPSAFQASLNLNGFFCGLALDLLGDVASMFGVSLTGIVAKVVSGILGSAAVGDAITNGVNAVLLSYTASGSVGQGIRLCAIDFVPTLHRFSVTLPIVQPDGYYCGSGNTTPEWGQFTCPLQDLMVIMSLQTKNWLNLNVDGIATGLSSLIGNIGFPYPATVSASLSQASLQVCATTDQTTTEEFLGISLGLSPPSS